MILKPRKGFSFIVKFIDFFNPVIVLLSIAGLILEYTQYKEYVLYPNRIIDMIFVADFLLRLISFPSARYFFKAYGWVDFLASIPGFTAFMQFGQYFGLFKVMRIGRFFKIIRVLRFLRIFSFLKKMKGDSAFIQERIMKIGVTIVIVFVTGLGFTDYYITEMFRDLRAENINSVMELSRGKVSMLSQRIDNVVYYSDKGVLYDSEGNTSDSYSDYSEKVHSINSWFIELRFSDNTIDHSGNFIPVKGVLVSADDLMVRHDNIMLILISSLIMILVILIFYIGYIFARDMKIVQLINDSVDAGDYWLLKEEAKKYSSTGELSVEEGEDEIISLIKMAAVLAEKAEPSSSGLEGMAGSMFSDGVFSGDFSSAVMSADAAEDEGLNLSESLNETGESFDLSADSLEVSDESQAPAAEVPSMSDGNGFSLNAFDEKGSDFSPGDSSELSSIDMPLSDAGFELSEQEEAVLSASGIMSDTADVKDSGNIEGKLSAIEKTVREIKTRLSEFENVQDKALETVARDAASRAVKITSKSIGEYIHKKLSGK